MSQNKSSGPSSPLPLEPEKKLESFDQNNLQALTMKPDRLAAEQAQVSVPVSPWRLKGTSGLAASLLLAGSLLLTGCGDNTDDCIPSTPPAGVSSSGSSGSFAGSNSASDFGGTGSGPTTPASAQFTSGSASGSSGQVYCRSRRTGGYYWYGGSRGSSSSSGGGASS